MLKKKKHWKQILAIALAVLTIGSSIPALAGQDIQELPDNVLESTVQSIEEPVETDQAIEEVLQPEQDIQESAIPEADIPAEQPEPAEPVPEPIIEEPQEQAPEEQVNEVQTEISDVTEPVSDVEEDTQITPVPSEDTQNTEEWFPEDAAKADSFFDVETPDVKAQEPVQTEPTDVQDPEPVKQDPAESGTTEEPAESQQLPANVLEYCNKDQERVQHGYDPVLSVRLTGVTDFPEGCSAYVSSIYGDLLNDYITYAESTVPGYEASAQLAVRLDIYQNGYPVKPQGKTKVELTVPGNQLVNQPMLLHQKEDGELEQVSYQIFKDDEQPVDHVVFEVDYLSAFLFVTWNEKPVAAQEPEDTPETAENPEAISDITLEETSETVVQESEPDKEQTGTDDSTEDVNDTDPAEQNNENAEMQETDTADTTEKEDEQAAEPDAADTVDETENTNTDEITEPSVQQEEINDNDQDAQVIDESIEETEELNITDNDENKPESDDVPEIIYDTDETINDEEVQSVADEDTASIETEPDEEDTTKTYEFEDSEVVITATVSHRNVFPSETEFVCNAIDEKSEEYAQIRQKLVEFYDVPQDTLEIFPYDVRFMIGAEEIEPTNGTVTLKFELKKPIEIQDESQTAVVHLRNEEHTEILSEDVATSGVIDSFEVNMDSFSPVVLTVLNGPTASLKSIHKQDTDGNEYWISKTANINESGTATSQYAHRANVTDVVEVSGAVSLHVDITYGGEGIGCDWLYIKDASGTILTRDANGATVGATGSGNAGKIGGAGLDFSGSKSGTTQPANTVSYDFEGDTLQFTWRTDSSVAGYGYYAVITPTYPTGDVPDFHFEELEDGTYALVFDKGGEISGFASRPDLRDRIADYKDHISEIRLHKGTTALTNSAFKNLPALQKVTMPRNSQLTTIDKNAFANCENLESIDIPASVTSIDASAFSNCKSLERVTFDSANQMTTLPAGLFKNCTALKNVTLPGNLTTISNSLFEGCTQLMDVTLPDSVTTIGSSAFRNSGISELPESPNLSRIETYAFYNCKNLTEVNIPSAINYIGTQAFASCSNVTDFIFEDGSPMTTLPAYMFSSMSKLTNVKLPENLTRLPNYCFQGCSALKKVDIPDTVTALGDYAFSNCIKLQDFEIPAQVKTLGPYLFQSCSSLKDMSIPNTVTSIGSSLFSGCSNLIKVEFEDGSPITSLPSGMFSNCSKLEHVKLPDGVTAIPSAYFYGCTSLTHVDLPVNLTAISDSAFYNCYNLEQIDLPDGLKTIGSSVFYNCDKITDVVIPKTVTSLGSSVWQSCDNLRSVVFEEGSNFTSLNAYLFYACTNLEELVLPSNLKSIPNYMCTNCTKLANIVIPSGVTSIGQQAFEGCKALTHVDFPAALTSIYTKAFINSGLTEIELPDRLRAIGDYAFSNTKITEVEIPNTVTSVGSYAFYSCLNLETVTFEEGGGNCTIGNYTFSECPALNEVDFKDKTTTIGNYAFRNDKRLSEIVIPPSVTGIGSGAFQNCTGIKRLEFPASTNAQLYIDTGNSGSAFNGLTNVEEIIIDRNITSNYKQTTNFNNLNPNVVFTIGKHVDTLDNMFVSLFNSQTNVNFEGENDFTVTTRISNTTEDPKWAELQGDFYVDPDGVVYKLNKSTGEASLFYIPSGLTEYTVPATVTSVAGRTYNVTRVDSYVGRTASDLTALVFEDPESVTIPQFAFTGCSSLQTINGEPELYPEDWASVSLLCDFPVHSDIVPEQVLILQDTTELGEPGEGGEAPRFSFGVTISGQERMADDNLTYVYPTGLSARLDFAISNESNVDMSDRVIRIYYAFDGDNYTMGNYVPGNDYTLVNTATGARYPLKVRATDAQGVYYYDITGFKPGDTLAFNNQFAYLSPKSGGGTMRIWVESISAEEAAAKEGKTSEPGKYILADWYTTPVPYNLTKQVNSNPTFEFVANSDDENDDNIYVKNLNYRIDLNSSGSSGTSYAKDYVKYVDFSDDLKLQDGMIWNPEIVNAVRNGDYYVSNGNYVYAKINGEWVEVCHMSFPSNDCVRGISCEVVTDDNGNDAIRVNWSYKNTYWSNVKTAPTADMPATIYYLSFGKLAVEVKRDSDLWNMLREGEEFSAEESEAMRKIANKVSEVTHYSFSEDQENEAQTPQRQVYLTTGFSMTKQLTGVSTFGREHGYKISLINNGLTNKDDIDLLEDSMREHYYIEPDDIEGMFLDEKWGPFVRIDISSATLCQLPDIEVVDVHGNTIPEQTAQQAGISPVPFNGCAPAGSDASEITTSAKMSIYWNESRTNLILDVKNDGGVVQQSYTIGNGCDYASLEDAFNAIGYVVTYRAAYKVSWDLDNAYTLYKAQQAGIEAESISNLTAEQIAQYEYKLRSGRTDVFTIPARTKKTTMWLTQDEPGYYHNSSVSSSNTAYARNNTGQQVGSANWSGYVYRELTLSKSASANGQTWSSNIKVPDDTVIDYTLTFTNSGAEYDILPLTDKMGGAQVLLVPVHGNRNALYYAEGTETGVRLEDADLDIYYDNGIAYYILDKSGNYKQVAIDGRIADTIQVTKASGSTVTLMTWYYQNVTGYSVNANSVSRTLTYKALANAARVGGQTSDASGSTVTKSSLANESWLGGHQTHRLYASLYGESEQMQFSKHIVEDPEAARERLISHSLIQDGDTVLYKMIIQNTGDASTVLTGSQIHDELPTTSGVFAWSKDNVKNIWYVTEDLGSSVETVEPEYWYVNSIQPNSGADTASSGKYYIYWNNDFEIHFGPKSEVWIYVELEFPGSDDTDPISGESTHAWDNYITRNNGATITNYFYVGQRYSSVTHELVDVVEGKLQKGVLDSGLSRSGYFQSEDTRHFYQNGGNVDNGSVQEVAYYTVVYNSGNVRLYLDPLQDQLPKGFQFRGIFNSIPKAADTSPGFSTSSYSLGSYSQSPVVSYLEERASSSSYKPVANVSDENRNSITYKNASISASTRMDIDGHQQVTFTVARASNNNSYLKYDSSLGKYYLDPGEAIRFGYTCTVEGYDHTENIATNEISMPVYDKYGLGVRMSGDEVTITPAKYRDIAVNDGGCDQTTTEEEVNGKNHTKPTWAKATTEWFSSNVSMQRLAPVPGVLKQVGGESYIATNVTIQRDQVYGTTYTSGAPGGSPYTGTVARTSIVNWEIRAYNEGGTGSNSMEDYWIEDTVDAPYMFTGNYFYDYYNVNGTKMTSSAIPIFSLGGRSENDTTVKISTGSSSATLTLDGSITINGDPVNVDGGRAQVQLLRDNETGVETLRIRLKDNYHRIPPNTYMRLYAHTQYVSNDAVLSKQFYNRVQLEPSGDFDPALVSQGKVLYRDNEGDEEPYAIESGASVTMTAGYASAARKQVTEMGVTSNTGWSDRTKNYIQLPEKYSRFYYDLYIDLPEDDPTSRLVLIDALPEPGDHSPFVARDKRDSEFVVRMLADNLGLHVWSSPNWGSGAKTELTTGQYVFQVNTKTEFQADDWDGNGAGWTTIDLSDGLSAEEQAQVLAARSFRIIIDDPAVVTNPSSGLMNKKYQVQVRFNAELESPEDANPGAIAWNSFGYRYTVPIGATGISTSLNAEPLKVGVMIPAVPLVVKDQKTPHGHYKAAVEDTEYRFLIYSGSALAALNDISNMSMADIAQILAANSRDVLITSLTIGTGTASGQTDYLDEEKKWTWNGTAYEPTANNWVWVNAQKYTILELPWADNGFKFSDIQHSPVNNYTFTQTTDNNIHLRVTNVYERTGMLKVAKTVTGPSFDPERKFSFTITLKDGKYPAYGIYPYRGTNIRDGSLTFNDAGVAVVQLKHGQSIELYDIPEDYTYTVAESEDPWYESESSNTSGSIICNTTQEVPFLNTRRSAELSVSKTVAGNMGNKTTLFSFEVYVIDEGRELSGTYTMNVTNTDGATNESEVTFAEGATIIQLRHGDTATISGLPLGARYEVDELAASRRGYTVTSTNDSGVLASTGTLSAWTNTKRIAIPTEIFDSPVILILIIVLAGAACLALFLKKKRG